MDNKMIAAGIAQALILPTICIFVVGIGLGAFIMWLF